MRDKDNIAVAGNLLKVELSNHTQPIFSYTSSKDWVEFGEFNNYPDYLIDLYNRNAIHGAIVKGKSAYVYGKGLDYHKSDITSVVELARLQLFLDNANRYETWNDVLEKTCRYFELFNGYAWQIIWSHNQKIAEVYCMEFSKLRRSKCGKKVFYCDKWVDEHGKPNQNPEKDSSFKEYDIYNPNVRTGTQILYFKVDVPTTQKYGHLYPIPEYSGCVADVETDCEITNFHFYNLKNGMFASALLALFNGEPSTEEKKKIAKMFNYTHTGTLNTGKVIFSFNDKGGTAPVLQTLTPSDLDKQFEQLGKRLQQNIFTGHRVDPVLFGVMTEGSLSDTGGTAVLNKWDKFVRTYIESRQQMILKEIQALGEINGLDTSSLYIKQTSPISINYSDPNISKFLSVDEVRKGLGLDPLIQSAESNSKIADALNSMSPLVATKVLDTMTNDEIRSLAGLTNPNVKTDINGMPVQQAEVNEHLKNLTGKQWININRIIRNVNSGKLTKESGAMMLKNGFGLNDEDINTLFITPVSQFAKFESDKTEYAIELFTKYAEDDNDDEVVSEDFVHIDNDSDALKSELKFMKRYFASPYETDAQALQNAVLDMVTGNPFLTNEEMAKQLGVSVELIPGALSALVTAELLLNLGNTYEPTQKAINKNVEPVETEVYTVYKYVVRPDVPKAVSGSRPFCSKLVELSSNGKRWTREEIENISNDLGEDAWSFRGGFYTNPKDGETTPYCRHIWKSIVKRRKKSK